MKTDDDNVRRWLASAISRSPKSDRYRQHHGPSAKDFEMADDILSEFSVVPLHKINEAEADALEDAADAYPTYGTGRVGPNASEWLLERATNIRTGIHP